MKINDKIWKQVYKEQFNESFKTKVNDGRTTAEEEYWLETCEKMVKRALTLKSVQEEKG